MTKYILNNIQEFQVTEMVRKVSTLQNKQCLITEIAVTQNNKVKHLKRQAKPICVAKSKNGNV